jgi:hypothetical protein
MLAPGVGTMIHGLADRVACVFVRRGIVQLENHDIYTYAEAPGMAMTRRFHKGVTNMLCH